MLSFSACATLPRLPCSEGGQKARENAVKGDHPNKQCYQRLDRNKKWVNDGPYIEWHPNGKRALLGEYRMGLKHGKWEEWDDVGKPLYEKHFVDGKEVPRFNTPDKPIKVEQAAPVAAKPGAAAAAVPVAPAASAAAPAAPAVAPTPQPTPAVAPAPAPISEKKP